jgi:hypothetical protein
MSILFKPNGGLDIQTESTDLPEQGDGKGAISSGAMVRCKNLDVSRMGLLSTRSGSFKLANFGPVAPIVYIYEAGGNRYEFGGAFSYINEIIVSTGGQVETPTLTPAGGSYAATQLVTIASKTTRAKIYFTMDGSTPNEQSQAYSVPIYVPVATYIICYAVDPSGYLIDSEYVVSYYSDTSGKLLLTESGKYIITETNSDNLTTEGG